MELEGCYPHEIVHTEPQATICFSSWQVCANSIQGPGPNQGTYGTAAGNRTWIGLVVPVRVQEAEEVRRLKANSKAPPTLTMSGNRLQVFPSRM